MKFRNVSIRHKKCRYCEYNLPITEFYSYLNSKGKRLYRPECKKCRLAINNYNTQEKIMEILEELNIDYKCKKCSYSKNTAALHFHHKVKKEKLYEISKMRTFSKERLKEEISKCDILCANCHIEEHHPHLNR